MRKERKHYTAEEKVAIGSDQRLDLVGGENSPERRLRVSRMSAKSPTPRREHEKWGTRLAHYQSSPLTLRCVSLCVCRSSR